MAPVRFRQFVLWMIPFWAAVWAGGGLLKAGEEPERRYAVVLDAGHGGADVGVQRETGAEKNLTLQIATRVASLLESEPGVNPVLTRKGDYPLSFDERRRIANAHDPGIFISLHFAAAPSPSTKGPRIYVMPPASPSDRPALIPFEEAHAPAASRSLHLASVLAASLQSAIPETEMEIARLPLDPLLGITIPAVLIECDFLTSEGAAAWRDPEAVERFSRLLVTAIDQFLSEGKNPAP